MKLQEQLLISIAIIIRNRIRIILQGTYMGNVNQYNEKVYKLSKDNTNNNSDGKAVIQENDEWRDEKEWDAVFEQLQKEQKNPQQ